MKFLFLLMLLAPMNSFAVTATVTNTFQSGQKIVSSAMNQNFSDLLGYINGQLTDTNIYPKSLTNASLANRTITAAMHATTTDYYIQNHRKGCGLAYFGTTALFVTAPCEIIVDGAVGRITATSTVLTSASIDTGALASDQVYYVYGKPNASYGIDFEYSLATPTVTTARKPSDSTKRYIGSVTTRLASAIFKTFRNNGNTYIYDVDADAAPLTGGNFALTTSAVDYFVNIPTFAKFAITFPIVTVSSAGACSLLYSPNTISSATVAHLFQASITGFVSSYIPLYFDSGYLKGAKYVSANNCTGITLKVIGYEEPKEFY